MFSRPAVARRLIRGPRNRQPSPPWERGRACTPVRPKHRRHGYGRASEKCRARAPHLRLSPLRARAVDPSSLGTTGRYRLPTRQACPGPSRGGQSGRVFRRYSSRSPQPHRRKRRLESGPGIAKMQNSISRRVGVSGRKPRIVLASVPASGWYLLKAPGRDA